MYVGRIWQYRRDFEKGIKLERKRREEREEELHVCGMAF